MFHKTNLPLSYWSYAFSIVVYLLNQIPSSILNFVSPWQKLYLKKPPLQVSRVFGCACFPFLRPYSSYKFGPNSNLCLFLGYPPLSKGYIRLEVSTGNVYLSPHCIFHESIFPSLSSLNSMPVSSPPSSSLPSLNPWLATLIPVFIPSPFVSPLLLLCLPFLLCPFPPLILFLFSLLVLPLLSQPSPLMTVNTHPMLTRSKNGILSLKSLLCKLTMLSQSLLFMLWLPNFFPLG